MSLAPDGACSRAKGRSGGRAPLGPCILGTGARGSAGQCRLPPRRTCRPRNSTCSKTPTVGEALGGRRGCPPRPRAHPAPERRNAKSRAPASEQTDSRSFPRGRRLARRKIPWRRGKRPVSSLSPLVPSRSQSGAHRRGPVSGSAWPTGAVQAPGARSKEGRLARHAASSPRAGGVPEPALSNPDTRESEETWPSPDGLRGTAAGPWRPAPDALWAILGGPGRAQPGAGGRLAPGGLGSAAFGHVGSTRGHCRV